MGFFTPAQKEEIRDRVPLEELLRDYNVHLNPAGRKLKGLCPFHQEKTPSFFVDPEKQLYYCYGCQEGGDLFRFVEVMDRLEFPEAVEMLARRAGVALEPSPGERGAGGRRIGQGGIYRRQGAVELYDALAFAARWYHQLLLEDPRGEPARQYLTKRGIKPEMWRRFQLGYSLPEWDALIRRAAQERPRGGPERAFSAETLQRAGLVRRREQATGPAERAHYDHFRGRLMFPVTDMQNRVIGFGARTLGDDVPKYINTASTALFDKSQVLYGLAQAKEGTRRQDQLGIVEGYTDAIVAHQAGLDYFVASLGTAFTRENARSLGRLASRVTMVFDGDAAGQNASERSLDLLVGADLDVKVFTLEPGKDPCDTILILGGEEFRRRLDADAVGIFDFKWRCTVGSIPAGESAASRARALDEFLRLLLHVPNSVTRRLILREYLERMGVTEKDADERLQRLSRSAVSAPVARAGRAAEEAPREPLEPLAELVLECLFAVPEKAALLWEQVPEGLFGGEVGCVLAQAIHDQLKDNSLSAIRLAKEIEDSEANRIVVKALSRLESDRDSLADDHEIVWTNCFRDIKRWKVRKRVAELQELKDRARAEGDRQGFEAYREEYTRLLKTSKR